MGAVQQPTPKGEGSGLTDFWQRLQRPRALLIGMVLLFAVTGLGFAGGVAWVDLQSTRAMSEIRAEGNVRQLAERAARLFDVSDQLLSRIEARLARHGEDEREMARLSAQLLGEHSFIANIYVVDRQGKVQFDAKGFHPAGFSLASQDWVKAGDESGASVGPALFDQASRTYVIPVWRALQDGNGVRQGKAALFVRIDHFRHMPGFDPDENHAMGLIGLNGSVVMRQPWRVEDVGRDLSNSSILNTYLSRDVAATYRGRMTGESASQVISYRLLPDRGLVAWVTVDEAGALARWQWRLTLNGMATILVLGIMAGLAWWMLRGLARERQAAADIAAANRDLARSNADLEQFAYIASHDLKEPLRNIASYVQLLQRRYQGRLDADADAFIGYTVDGVTRLQAIINELLAYSRIGTGQLTLVPCQTGILVSTALTHLKSVISDAQAVVDVIGPLPVVEADASLIGSLFQNLISNALKYRREDVRPTVEIGCEEQSDTWRFYVRDNGIGIDQQYHRQIFDLFKRLHTKDKYGGTGIGLAICQRVVERHGGKIGVDSEAAKGSTFWFTLPKRRNG